jgi:hypothetical protein
MALWAPLFLVLREKVPPVAAVALAGDCCNLRPIAEFCCPDREHGTSTASLAEKGNFATYLRIADL